MKAGTLSESGCIRPHLTPLECGIIFGGIPAGAISRKGGLIWGIPVYPFQEDGITLPDVIRILEESGLGLPSYMSWGRTRSGCFFCFYQQKIEWVRLKEVHPDLYEEAKRI